MGNSIRSHAAWCIIRLCNGRFERVREGYSSAENARRGIPFVAARHVAEGGDRSATYAVGRYIVGDAVPISGFQRCA